MRVVFWDWTGTLVDELDCDRHVCLGMERMYDEAHGAAGEGARKYRGKLEEISDSWKWYNYPAHGKYLGIDWKKPQLDHVGEITPFAHAAEMLQKAHGLGYKNCACTNAVTPVFELRARHLNLFQHFDGIIGSDTVRAMKAEGRHLPHGLRMFSAWPDECLMVGDDLLQDIAPAKRSGMRAVLCDHGKRTTYMHTELRPKIGEPLPPDATIHSLDELEALL